MFWVLPATLPATTSSAPTEFYVSHGPDEDQQQARDRERHDKADHERDRPHVMVGECGEGDHLPTATLRSARAECRILTPSR